MNILVDADAWLFFVKTKHIYYILSPLVQKNVSSLYFAKMGTANLLQASA